MTWVVLGLVPVLWVVELTGPEWVNLSLRAIWVVVALGTVVAGVVRYSADRRRRGRPGTGADGHRR